MIPCTLTQITAFLVGIVMFVGVNSPVQASSLKVMTWNIAGGGSGDDNYPEPSRIPPLYKEDPNAPLNRLVRAIARFRPDVVGLQEVHRDQVARVTARLRTGTRRYYASFFATKPAGDSAKDYGIAILSRHPFIVEYGFEYRDQHPADRREKRSLAGVTIRIGGSEAISVMTTHLTVNGERDCEAVPDSVRTGQANQAFAFAAGPGPARSIVMGDFNAQKGTSAYEKAGAFAFDDAFFKQRHQGVGSQGYTAGSVEGEPCPPEAHCVVGSQCAPNRRKIDHIFVGRSFKVQSVRNATKLLSDHRPVIATLTYR